MKTLDDRNLNQAKREGIDIFSEGIVLEIHHDGKTEDPAWDIFYYRLDNKEEWNTVCRQFCSEISNGTAFSMQPCNMREVSEKHIICDTKSSYKGPQYAKH